MNFVQLLKEVEHFPHVKPHYKNKRLTYIELSFGNKNIQFVITKGNKDVKGEYDIWITQKLQERILLLIDETPDQIINLFNILQHNTETDN